MRRLGLLRSILKDNASLEFQAQTLDRVRYLRVLGYRIPTQYRISHDGVGYQERNVADVAQQL